MSLRDYIHKIDLNKKLIHIHDPISKTLEIAGVLKQLEPQTAVTAGQRLELS